MLGNLRKCWENATHSRKETVKSPFDSCIRIMRASGRHDPLLLLLSLVLGPGEVIMGSSDTFCLGTYDIWLQK